MRCLSCRNTLLPLSLSYVSASVCWQNVVASSHDPIFFLDKSLLVVTLKLLRERNRKEKHFFFLRTGGVMHLN